MHRQGVAEAPVFSLAGRFCCLDTDIHNVVEDQLFSAVSAWDGDFYVLLSAVLRVVEEGHYGVLKVVLVVLE